MQAEKTQLTSATDTNNSSSAPTRCAKSSTPRSSACSMTLCASSYTFKSRSRSTNSSLPTRSSAAVRKKISLGTSRTLMRRSSCALHVQESRRSMMLNWIMIMRDGRGVSGFWDRHFESDMLGRSELGWGLAKRSVCLPANDTSSCTSLRLYSLGSGIVYMRYILCRTSLWCVVSLNMIGSRQCSICPGSLETKG